MARKHTAKYEIHKMFKEVAEKMKSEYREIKDTTSHPAVKGYLFEETFRTFLKKYLPASLEVSRGFIVDSTGKQSKELDIIISDKSKTPIFYLSGDARVIPVETVYAVIEVKSSLELSKLRSIIENMESVRNLKKKAYVYSPPNVTLNIQYLTKLFPILKTVKKLKKEDYQIPCDFQYTPLVYGRNDFPVWPIHYFIFAFDSVALSKIKKRLENIYKKDRCEPWDRIDCIGVLNKGVIVNKTKSGVFLPFPHKDTSLAVISSKDYALMEFFGLISNLLLAANIPGNIKYTKYFSPD